MSAVHSRDIEAHKRASAWDKKWADEDLRQLLDLWSEDFFEYDILRAPLPPEDPEEGMIWPIYARHPRTGKWRLATFYTEEETSVGTRRQMKLGHQTKAPWSDCA
ncbi:MAG: hypothetical protein ACYTBJ_25805 [Planctomycetota bacterium]|jgi:hypothetical protein